MIITRMFEKNAGDFIYQITKCQNGYEAFKAVQDTLWGETQDFFDIILLDLQMPIMNGFEAAAKIYDLYNKESMFDAKERKIMQSSPEENKGKD